MCIIALTKKENTPITKERFYKMDSANSDGIGIMWREKGEVKTQKFLSKTQADDGYKFYLSLLELDGVDDICVHFRLSTHWGVSLDNTHPFKYTEGGYMVHNGVMNLYSKEHPNKSDTRLLAEFMESFGGNDLLYSPVFASMLMAIKGWSRFVFMNKEKTIKIGDFIQDFLDGNYYSNGWYKTNKDYNFYSKPQKDFEEDEEEVSLSSINWRI